MPERRGGGGRFWGGGGSEVSVGAAWARATLAGGALGGGRRCALTVTSVFIFLSIAMASNPG